jgi:membrane fusion protein (multidrug efflux system)
MPDKEPQDPKDGDKDEPKGPPKEEKPKKPFRPPVWLIAVGIFLLCLAIIGGLYVWHYSSTHEGTDDAYISGHVHQFSSRVTGTVAAVLVEDNQAVHAGDVLVKLDPRDFEVTLQKAQASLAETQAQAVAARAGAEQARASKLAADGQVKQANAHLEDARLNYERDAGLFQRDMRAISKQQVDTDKTNLDAAQGQADATAAQAAAAAANVQSADAQAAVADANILGAQAQVRDAELQLSYTSIIAPVDGHVSRKTVEVGQRIAPGQALLALVEANVWVLANMKETQLKKIEIGQVASIKIDALKGMTFVGRVNSIQAGSGAEFSLLPPDNATGNFTKIVQRVPVKIVFDEESIRDFHDKIVPGLSVEPEIDLTSLRDHQQEDELLKTARKQNRDREQQRAN